MATYSMHRTGSCPVQITGTTIIEAIESNFAAIAQEAEIGNAAGYHLRRVVSTYKAGILGGKGGVEVEIEADGMPICHTGSTEPHKTATVWIEAQPSDLPAPHTHQIL